MLRPLIVVTGTGTGIGKTHLACALLRAWGRRSKVCGVKPVESGVAGILGDDAIRLAAASTFHVTHPPPYTFPDPISPHLAARRVGAEVRPDVIARYVAEVREAAEGTLVELAGGLFSPVTDRALNADIARMLQPTATLLVAPDRLGVLHDLGATTRAAEREGVRLAGVALVAPELPDASTGTNAAEMRWVTEAPLLGSAPRAGVEELANHPEVLRLLQRLLGEGSRLDDSPAFEP